MAKARDYYPLLNGVPSSAEVDGGEPRTVTVRVTAKPVAAERKWDMSCANCFGNCDGVGWGVCCLTTWCFPCMFGFLKYRAFGDLKRAFAWALLFIVLAAVPRVYSHIFFEEDHDDDSEYSEHSEVIVRNGVTVIEKREEFKEDSDYSLVKPEFSDDAKTIIILYFVMVAVCWIIMTISGIYNRMQMRKKFGITASGMCCECAPDVEDSCLWIFCHGCATCQEARTLITNRVENGEWQGPLGTVTVQTAATGVPASGVTAVPMTHAVAPLHQDFDVSAKV
ncbi:unnamed protein product [Ostreobium quekettii]|uniref:Uncharacterized protein n=1 Tax=Ostreobium quekettii TaxID=121088 RepID=A0A8S1J3J9_9CHLO|nr:unnamed protein product [Ostreobium quekettii]|eukprot:evm.model.scf_63.17 EVM.evm.TU.scf_63.17   scf_63:126638-128600(-)